MVTASCKHNSKFMKELHVYKVTQSVMGVVFREKIEVSLFARTDNTTLITGLFCSSTLEEHPHVHAVKSVRHEGDGHLIASSKEHSVGDSVSLGCYTVAVANIPPTEKVLTHYQEEAIKDHQETVLAALDKEDPEFIRKYFPGACYVVTRSYQPEDNTPWKRYGRRSYSWLVSLENRDAGKGRRIEWGGDTVLYATRKDALKALYGK